MTTRQQRRPSRARAAAETAEPAVRLPRRQASDASAAAALLLERIARLLGD